MKWHYCKFCFIKYKGDVCPECIRKKSGILLKNKIGGEFKKGLENYNENYIKRELGIDG